MKELIKYVLENVYNNKLDKDTGANIIKLVKENSIHGKCDIAIIGIGTTLPGCDTVDDFWENVKNGVVCNRKIPAVRKKDMENYYNAIGQTEKTYLECSYLNSIDQFDYNFFHISPNEAKTMDPYQRLFLQTVHQSIEDAGYGGKRLCGSNTGVFVGYAPNANDCYYKMLHDINDNLDPNVLIDNISAIIPSRISHLLDLHGPAMLIDTACSSSLVAVHQACLYLKNKECSMAIAGGIKVNLQPVNLESTQIGLSSSDGLTRSFDNNSEGAGKGEGIISIVLKPLDNAMEDGDHIYAVIKGSAVNQDGNSMSLTAPNPMAQKEVITSAWNAAGIDPKTLAYIEVHGTGTKLGDPIEIEALDLAVRQYTKDNQCIPISTVKSVYGHLFECSGMAGLLNAVMSIKHRQIPPSLHFNLPNSNIGFNSTAFYVNTKLQQYSNPDLMRCGVSSFGLSGTNCHMVLEEAPKRPVCIPESKTHLLCLSASTKTALHTLINKYKIFLESTTDTLENICFTTNMGRGHYSYRVIIIAQKIEDLKKHVYTIANQVDWSESDCICYGYHKIVSPAKVSRKDYEITASTVKNLTNLANELIDSILNHDAADTVLLQLAQLYTQGADIDFKKYYQNEKYNIVSLPTYPFEEKRCWMDIDFLKPSEEIAEHNPLLDSLYYSTQWQKSSSETISTTIPTESFLVIGGESLRARTFLEELKNIKKEIVHVTYGDSYIQNNAYEYQITALKEDIEKLIEDLKTNNIVKIIDISGLDYQTEANQLGQLKDRLHLGIYALQNWVRALLATKSDKNLELMLITNQAYEIDKCEDFIIPENAMIHGFGQVIEKEIPEICCYSIDVDLKTPFHTFMNEICTIHTKSDLVAYRENVRYQRVFSFLDEIRPNNKTIEVTEGKVYLVTGGLGGIGFELSKYFALKAPVHLVFIGQTKLPKYNLLEKSKTTIDVKGKAKLEKIQALKNLGSTVDYFNVDISNLENMKAVISWMHKTYGKLNGVIHCAGISADCPFIDKSEDEFIKVMKPKTEGTWILDKLTTEDTLDFFIMCSSIATIFSMQGQGDYVAANAYMDSFCKSRSRSGKRTLTVNWTTWKETGMAYNSGFAVDTIFKALSTQKAIEGFEHLIKSDFSQGVIGLFNHDGIGIPLLERSGVRLSKELIDKINCLKEINANHRIVNKSHSKKGISNPEHALLTGREDGSYNEIERILADICRKTLGFEEIDVYENFFEMGADSIILMKIQAEIENSFLIKLHPADMFEFSTVVKLAEHLLQKNADSIQTKSKLTGKVRKEHMAKEIAIIGIALQFPMADDKEQFWQNIKNGLDCITEPPNSRKEEVIQYAKYRRLTEDELEFNQGGYINGADSFDYNYFRIPPKEAKLMDPNQRIFLQTAMKAIEDAGYGGEKIIGSNTGVYLGFASTQMYLLWYINETQSSAFSSSLIGNTAAVASGRLSYLLNLKGPSLVIDTACSSSLVAVHTACKALQSGECDMALAGGVRLNMVPVHQKGVDNGIGMDSTDGRARTFDYHSDGTGSGEGVAVLLLKPLDAAIHDNDNIYAVVKGSAVNQDGSSAGITAPNPAAQEDVLLKAWQDAGVAPETIEYIETHGTGTPLGDPIEIKGIKNAFKSCTDRKQFCAVSSVKSNIAHLSEAAGIAGMLNAIMALQKKEIPPSKYFVRPNKDIEFDNSPVYVNTVPRKWITNGHLRRCGISAFGMSGTNCHIVLEEFEEKRSYEKTKQRMIFTLSAKSEERLQKQISNYLDFFKTNTALDIDDICYTTNTGREPHAYRVAYVIQNLLELQDKLIDTLHTGLTACTDEIGYYGYHKIVSERTERLNKNEITEYQKRDLTQKALDILKNDSSNDRNLNALNKLCELYVQGAQINWDTFYQHEIRRRISLPTYPFENKHCWIDVPEYEEPDTVVYGENNYYRHEWLETKHLSNDASINGVTIVLKGRKKICREFIDKLRNCCEVIEVELSTDNLKISENHYKINGQQDGYNWFFTQVKNKNLQKFVHMLTLDEDETTDTLEKLNSTLQKGVYSLLRIGKAIAHNGIKTPIDIALIAKYADQITGEELVNPCNQAMFGLGKAIRLESANQLIRSLDIDEEVTALQIIEELKSESDNYHTAYRAGKKYVSIFKEYEPEYEPEQMLTIKDGNTYVITGGTGGIAMEMGLYLAAKAKVKLVLLSRSEIPPKNQWEDILKYSRDSELIRKIKNIKKIEETGSQVFYYCTDVSDFNNMSTTFNLIHQELGGINGIIHTAGLGGGGFAFQKSEQDFSEVLAPKIHGTWILDYLTKTDTLDFFIMCSSIASIFPGMGQGDYAAGNAYLDSFAAYKNARGQKALTINWVAWKDTGMAIKYGVNTDDTFKALSTEKAMEAFDELIQKKIFRAVVGELNYRSEKITLLKKLPIRISKKLERAIGEMLLKIERKKKELTNTLDIEVKLKGRDNLEFSDVENKLAMIYGQILGFEEIDIYDNFFELGGDSILLSRMYELIDATFPGKFKLLDLFEYTSISKLAAEILKTSDSNKTAETPDTNLELEEKLNQMLNQVDDGELSVDEMLNNISNL